MSEDENGEKKAKFVGFGNFDRVSESETKKDEVSAGGITIKAGPDNEGTNLIELGEDNIVLWEIALKAEHRVELERKFDSVEHKLSHVVSSRSSNFSIAGRMNQRVTELWVRKNPSGGYFLEEKTVKRF